MKKFLLLLAFVAMPLIANAQGSGAFIHDPSTIMISNGKYYTFGTGVNGLQSVDGWNWTADAIRPHSGAAPDAIKIGDRYLVAWNNMRVGRDDLGHSGQVFTMWNKTLDPNDPDFEYSEPICVAYSVYDEDHDAIDPGFLMGPDGRLWVSFGTYFGTIRIVELDPETGGRKAGVIEKDVAIDCEASALMYRDGWYYLLGTHGTCCDGGSSTYNIVVGRSKSPMGPYVDELGRDMLQGGGRLVMGSYGPYIGAGHFARYIEDEGIDKFSLHYEADLTRSGRSILAVRPLIWENGWPVGQPSFEGGTFAILNKRRGYSLELTVDYVRYRGGMHRGPRLGSSNQDDVVLENQKLEDVQDKWPAGNTEIRIGEYIVAPHQRWTFTPVPEAGGYLSDPYFKVTIAGTERALVATEDLELASVPQFTGEDNQLWRVEQCTDGSYRIMPKAVPGHEGEKWVLVSVADSTPSLGKWDFNNINCKWYFSER